MISAEKATGILYSLHSPGNACLDNTTPSIPTSATMHILTSSSLRWSTGLEIPSIPKHLRAYSITGSHLVQTRYQIVALADNNNSASDIEALADNNSRARHNTCINADTSAKKLYVAKKLYRGSSPPRRITLSAPVEAPFIRTSSHLHQKEDPLCHRTHIGYQ